jgi:hypothetical protein
VELIKTDEPLERGIARIARAWFEQPCPPEEGPYCNPDMHDWDRAHEDDKAYALAMVAFVLHEAGIG